MSQNVNVVALADTRKTHLNKGDNHSKIIPVNAGDFYESVNADNPVSCDQSNVVGISHLKKSLSAPISYSYKSSEAFVGAAIEAKTNAERNAKHLKEKKSFNKPRKTVSCFKVLEFKIDGC